MSTSQIFTIGTALRRAEDNNIPVEVLVEGQWITGSIAGLDGDGLVLVTPERVQCVVRNAHISVVRLLAGLPEEEPAEPQETTFQYADRGAQGPSDPVVPDDGPAPWAMPSAQAADPHALGSEEVQVPALALDDHDDEQDADRRDEQGDDHEGYVVGSVTEEGPREIEAGSWVEPVQAEPTADEPTDEPDEPRVFALPPVAPGEPSEPIEPIELSEAPDLDHLAAQDEPTTPGGSVQTEDWRELLTALRSEARTLPAATEPERRRGRRLVMR